MMIGSLREAGPHAIETFCEQAQDWKSSRFETVACAVVCGDKDQPSHSVRLFKICEE
jgi:hypothetical protein